MKAIFTGLALICFILAMFADNLPVAAANAENPKLQYAQLNVSPLVQGVGGSLTIETYVQVNGTC
jgi:hypothetical protein